MADDASFLTAAAGIVSPPQRARSLQSIRTLFDTSYGPDAGFAGFDGPTDPEDEGFRVVFLGHGSQPGVEITLTDGRLYGVAAIRQLALALNEAAKMAERM